MKTKKFRWILACGMAFLMGFPMASKALAANAGDIVSSSISLILSIIGVAGNS